MNEHSWKTIEERNDGFLIVTIGKENGDVVRLSGYPVKIKGEEQTS